MLSRRLWVSAAATLLVSQASLAPAAAPLQPTKPWVLDYAETQCVAAREYGSATDPITFGIRPAPNGETYELLVQRQRPGPSYAAELDGSVDFGNGPIKAWLLHFRTKDKTGSIQQFRISAAQMAQGRVARAVSLHAKGAPDETFALGNMSALLSGLQTCTADLKLYWNMDGRETGKIAVPAKGDVVRIFSDADYPSEAQDRSQEGSAQFLLLIDEKGKVAACHVAKASGIAALDAMGCQAILKRAKFTPARDRAGKPARSTVVTPPIIWKLL
jgi:TonB family protein